MKIRLLEQALKVGRAAAVEAGTELIKHYGNVEHEAKFDTGETATDIVTILDRQTETLLADRLTTVDTSFGFRGEEHGVQKAGNTTWLVDPIDGTNHFVRGLPFCTTMIALIENGEVVLSIIHDFVRQDTYWAIKGQGAYKNNEKLQVSHRTLPQSLLSFETRLNKPVNLEAHLRLSQAAGGLISTINCGFEFSMIASGKLDGRITLDPYGQDWDYAPGSLLVTEAGGIISNHRMQGYDYQNHNFVATNPIIHAALTQGNEAIFPDISS